MPTGTALTDAVVAGILVTALVGVLVTWMIRCGAQFHGLPRSVDERLVSRQAAQESRLADALVLIFRAAIPEMFLLYLGRYAEKTPLFSSASLTRAAKEMDEDEDLRDLRARQLVTEPLVKALIPQVLDTLPTLAPSVALQQSVIEAILTLRCYAGVLGQAERRATVLSWRFGLQSLALLAVLAVTLLAVLGRVDPVATVLLGSVVTLHGIWTELQLRQLDRDIAVTPSLLEVPGT